MPNEGPAYPISDKWRRKVGEAIARLIKDKSSEIKSKATFATSAGIAKSSLTAALKSGSIQSTVMPQINAALGWPAPRVLSTPDELEIWAAAEAMSEREVGRLIERAEASIAKIRKERG